MAEQVTFSSAEVAGLLARLEQLEAQVIAIPSSSSRKEPKIAAPKPFSGKRSESQEFILKCITVFTAQASTYYDDKTKLAYAINLLEKEVYEWVKPAMIASADKKPAYIQTWEAFRKEFLKMFSDIDIKELSYQRIQALTQTGSASNYANEFRRHSLPLDWNDEPLRQHFFRGLKSEVKDKVLSPSDFIDLDALIENAIKWDNLLYQRRKDPNNKANEHKAASSNKPAATGSKPFTALTSEHKKSLWTPRPSNIGSGPAPMQVDSTQRHLSQEEKDYRRENRLCFYCGKPNHSAFECWAAKGTGPRKSVNSTDQVNDAAKESPQ